MIIKCSANYCKSNNNFVIIGIKNSNKKIKYSQTIKIVKNIINRGSPTTMSEFLKSKFKYRLDKDIEDDSVDYKLISKDDNNWGYSIKGAKKEIDNPALLFYNKYLPEYLGEYKFVRNLLLPEAPINDIIDEPKESYKDMAVDFYLPQAKLVVEIDGIQHNYTKYEDSIRDALLNNTVIRIPVKDIKENNDEFEKKLEQIKNVIIENETINKYKEGLEKRNIEKDHLIAIIRLQMTILEMLKNGMLSFDKKWNISISGISKQDSILAIEDLKKWFELIFNLQKINVRFPEYNLESKDVNSIKIDIDIFKHYDDTCNEERTIFVRNDYFENDKNYYKVECDINYKYKLNPRNLKDCELLEKLLKNIFNFSKYREGQIEIITNILSLKDSIGILATGTGKSLCYQISALLQPGITFIVCPLKSLVKDQKDSMIKKHITNCNKLDSTNNAKEKERIIEELADCKYQMMWITPERFQSENFRKVMKKINDKYNVAYAVIDEVHCMSEWGHDFRPSYLQLINTINNYIPTATKLGLTATATANVMKDLVHEFGIKNEDDNIITTLNFQREQLEFVVINCKNEYEKLKQFFNTISHIQNKNVLEPKGSEINEDGEKSSNTISGLVFSPFVGGQRGSINLCEQLQRKYAEYKEHIAYYVGDDKKQSAEEKTRIQEDYQKDIITLLIATKAFGMGIDKDNIRYIVHFGIPNSIEELYQEAGRAGRRAVGGNPKYKDEKSICYILHTIADYAEYKGQPEEEMIKAQKTTIQELKDDLYENGIPNYDGTQNSFSRGDIFDQLELFLSNNTSGEAEEIYETYCKFIKGKDYFDICVKPDNEKGLFNYQKSIYKLRLLGIVNDWTITYAVSKINVIKGESTNRSEEEVRQCVLDYVRDYDKDFSFEKYETKGKKYKDYVHKYIDIICNWYYDHIVYSRREALFQLDEIITKFEKDNEYSVFSNEYKKYCTDKFNEYINLRFDPHNYKVFLKYIDENSFDKALDEIYVDDKIDEKHLEGISATLERILVERRSNTVLNVLMGIVNIYLNRDEIGYRNDFAYAIEQISKSEDKRQVYEKILYSSKEMSDEMKDKLNDILLNYFNSKDELLLNYKYLKTNNVLKRIISIEKQRILKIEGGVLNGYRKDG